MHFVIAVGLCIILGQFDLILPEFATVLIAFDFYMVFLLLFVFVILLVSESALPLWTLTSDGDCNSSPTIAEAKSCRQESLVFASEGNPISCTGQAQTHPTCSWRDTIRRTSNFYARLHQQWRHQIERLGNAEDANSCGSIRLCIAPIASNHGRM